MKFHLSTEINMPQYLFYPTGIEIIVFIYGQK